MNHLDYLVLVVLGLVTILSLMVAAGACRTRDDEVAWQRQRDLAVMTRIADRADQLAAEGHHHPGTAAITEYEHQRQRAELYR